MFKRISRWLRNRFIAGFLVIFPLGFTFFILNIGFSLLDGVIGKHVEKLYGRRVPGVGLAVLLLCVLLAGVVVRSFVGRRVIVLYEAFVNRLPFAGSIYSGAKQLVEALSAGGGRSFRSVVMVPFPHPGSWAIGFVTSDGLGEVQARTPSDVTNVFIPTTPNPTSGFLVLVPKEQLIPLSMSVEEAIKMVVSGGVVSPQMRVPARPPPTGPDELSCVDS